MKVVFVLVVVTSFLADNHALPAGKERQREDVVTQCLIEVLSKALGKPDAQPLDPECRDILKAGPKLAPLDKKSNQEAVTHQQEAKGQEEAAPGAAAEQEADVEDIKALLKSVSEKRETPEDERSQESWGLEDEKEKRHHGGGEEEEEEGKIEKRYWKPTHRYHHKKHRKRDEELSEEGGEPGEERSQESWGLDDDTEKRAQDEEEDEEREKRGNQWNPSLRYRHRKVYKRSGDQETDWERSQESWGLDDDKEKRAQMDEEEEEDADREKRGTQWNPSLRYRHRKIHKRSGDPSQEGLEESEDREKRAWRPTHRYHHKKLRKRDEERSEEAREEEEPDEERSQESWGLEKRAMRPGTHRYHHRRLRKRDEEPSEEVREEEPDEERSQESWGLDDDKEKRAQEEEEEEEEEREKRGNQWNPSLRYRHRKVYKRSGDQETDWERSQESWDLEKRAEEEREREEALRYLAEKRSDIERHLLGGGKVYEKRSQWTYRKGGAKRRRSPEGPSHKEKQLENLAAMDRELQQIAEKMKTHDTRTD